MPYRLITENRGVYFHFTGDVDFKDIRRASADGWEHHNCENNIFQIWDYSEVGKFKMEQLEAILGSRMDNIAYSNFGQFTKIAIITDRLEIIEKYLIYRNYVDFDLLDVEIFLCAEDARNWVAKRDSDKFYSGLAG
ncbi:MAG: hypothetical protein P8P98_08955 [Emcibacteraceae bacterium]|nr:hypothetical protein [Emcibacteraceae bacterium]MDG1994881.1 hypothetical protein [Emcibacteraceae bacterium]